MCSLDTIEMNWNEFLFHLFIYNVPIKNSKNGVSFKFSFKSIVR